MEKKQNKMKPDSCIYILSFFPIFYEKEVKLFPLLDKKHSVDLYTALLLNHMEVLRSMNPLPSFFFCFDERDKEYLPEDLSMEKAIFYTSSGSNSIPGILIDKYFASHGTNLIICANTIGIHNKEIRKIFDTMNVDEEVIVIGRSNKERTAFVALNYDNPEIFEGIGWEKPNFDTLLSKACMFNNKINILDDYMLINSVDDFKYLYSQLSKKESLTYCSQAMHERFTNLFIEYKDILK